MAVRGQVRKFQRRADRKAREHIEHEGLTGDSAEIARLRIKCASMEGSLLSLAREIDNLKERCPELPNASG